MPTRLAISLSIPLWVSVSFSERTDYSPASRRQALKPEMIDADPSQHSGMTRRNAAAVIAGGVLAAASISKPAAAEPDSKPAQQDMFAASRERASSDRWGLAGGELNMYDKPLLPCGSQKCAPTIQCINAICIRALPSDFCEQTFQSKRCAAELQQPGVPASEGRFYGRRAESQQPYCVCLGAWSLYVKKGNEAPVIDCSAIPGTVLSDGYIASWKTWNGKEIQEQEIAGLEKLYDQCNASPSDLEPPGLLAPRSAFFRRFCRFVSGSSAFSLVQRRKLSNYASCASLYKKASTTTKVTTTTKAAP